MEDVDNTMDNKFSHLGGKWPFCAKNSFTRPVYYEAVFGIALLLIEALISCGAWSSRPLITSSELLSCS
nr:unnamed protein product [Haemonchus contortus]